MRAFGFISLLLTLGIIGYLMMNQTESAGLNQATADGALQSAERAAGQAKLAEMKLAITTYHRTLEKWPPNLEAVVDAGFINRVPSGMNYDPATGEVTLSTP